MRCFPYGRKLFVLVVISILSGKQVFSSELKVGDTLETYSLVDNHGKMHQLKADTEVVLLSFEMDKSKEIHNWLAEKEPDFLTKNKTEYIADITKMPAIITKLFAGPKMAKYKFPILLANEKGFAEKYPKSPQKITTLILDKNRNVSHILFLNNMDEVDGLIKK